MNFTVDFFKDEVRNGFYIPTAIKQGWAAGLVVLEEIDRICRKHDIDYFADWGTFLGAVRHGGFVPWDDDLDICMKRDDYDRFREVADIELPKEFVIHDYERKEDHQLFLARVVSNNSICFDEEHLLKHHNFPYMASVDIFILDYLYKDEDKERERCEEVKRLIAIADGILENNLKKDTIERELYLFEQKYNVKFDRNADNRHLMVELYKLAEKQMARVPKDEADCVGQIFPWILKGGKGHPRKYYENPINIPFENTTIPVPACYNEALKNHYGNYLVCYKVWGGHEYPYFEKQRENLQAVADFKLPEFTFSKDMLVRTDCKATYPDSLKGMAGECIVQLGNMTNQIETNPDVMSECQQLAVDLTTLVENVKGEDSECARLVVDKVQEYCDALFELFNLLAENPDTVEEKRGFEQFGKIKETLENVSSTVRDRVINRKEIVFLTTGPKEWKSFEPIYKSYIESDDADIYVVPLPVLFKDYFGRIIASDDELIKNTHLDDYPSDVKISLWTDFDMGLHHPDKIYIQNPYDGENPCLTVPPQFYAGEIRKYTDELIYVRPFRTGEFGDEDYTDLVNLKYYVTAPGVIYSDKVIVQSENMKNQYIKKLTDFAGEETEKIWAKKIEVSEELKNSKDKTAKKIFYLIGLNELSEHIGKSCSRTDNSYNKNNTFILDRIKERLEIFKENEGSISVTVGFYPPDINLWKKIDTKLTNELNSMLKFYGYSVIMLGSENNLLEAVADEFDAYYGSASPLVTIFTYNKKPVMIADYEVETKRM